MPAVISEESIKRLVIDVINEVSPYSAGKNVGDMLNEMQNKANDIIPVKFSDSEGWKVELFP